MNCEKCQDQLSDYLDGTLAASRRALLSGHLGECAGCAAACDELSQIVGAARECREELYTPPDARAMWLRISNVIEGERALRPAAAAAASARATGRRESLWSRVFQRRWELTLPQMAAAVAAICVSVSFITAVGVRGLMDVQTARDAEQANTRVARPTGEDPYPQGYLRQQQARISYLQQRVEQRKAAWNPRMRESFERSLNVLDQAVVDSLDELKRNPHDEVSEETLNSALSDKLELLREFGEQ